MGQHLFDSTRRTIYFNLTLRPAWTISPFLAYSCNSGFGSGVTTFTGEGNEFAVHNQLRDTSDYYRGGSSIFNLPRTSLPVEKEILKFKDDQWISQSGGSKL